MAETGNEGWAARSAPLSQFLVLYLLLYASFGVASPYLPAFVESRGIPAEQIGVIFAAGTAIRLLSAPLAGRLADRWRARREVLAACAMGAGIAALLYLPANVFWVLLLVSLLHAIALAPLTPLADALAVVAAHRPSGSFEYGWVRGTGSAAFIVGSIAIGWLVASLGLATILWWQAALLAAAALATRFVPEFHETPPEASPATGAGPTVTDEGLAALWHSPVYRRVVLVAALILGSHGMHDTFAMIRWTGAGIAPPMASVLWSLAVIAEVVVFFLVGPLLIRRLTPAGCIALAAVAGALRWTVAALTTDVVVLGLIQPLHGITFALLHLACMQLIATHVPVDLEGTAQAVYSTVGIGAATALVTLVSGWLFAQMGGAAFMLMSVLCLTALPVARSLAREAAAGRRGA